MFTFSYMVHSLYSYYYDFSLDQTLNQECVIKLFIIILDALPDPNLLS